MKNLITNLNVTNSINRAVKWEIGQPKDLDDGDVPVLVIPVTLYTEGTRKWPISPFTLYIRDSVPSEILIADQAATSLLQEFRISSQTLPGTPYTTLTTAMYATSGKASMRRAVEDLLSADPAWNASISYAVGAKVAYNSSIYRCTVAVTGGAGPATDTGHWATAEAGIGALPAVLAGA